MLALAAGTGGSSESDSLFVRETETLASLRWRRGHIDAAIATLREAERLERRRRPYPDPLAAELQLHRADLMSHVPGRTAEAIALARVGMAEQFAVVPPEDPRRSIAFGWAAPIIAMENLTEGIQMLRTSLAGQLAAFNPQHPAVIGIKQELALMLLRSGQTSEATELFREVVAHTKEQYGAHHTAYAAAIGYLADALMQVGAVDSAEKLIRRAVAIRTAIFGADAAITTLSSLGLARVAAARGDIAAADSIYDAARKILLRQTTLEHPDVRLVDSSRAALHVGSDEVRRVRPAVLRPR
jgi:tetratricopeptide (TPR) repeat protein